MTFGLESARIFVMKKIEPITHNITANENNPYMGIDALQDAINILIANQNEIIERLDGEEQTLNFNLEGCDPLEVKLKTVL